MFSFFRRKKNVVPLSSESNLIEGEIQVSGSFRSNKFVFIKRGGQVIFLDEDSDATWRKYAEALRRVLDASNLKDELKQIEFIENMENGGECLTNVIDGNLVITIRVASWKLRFQNGGFILSYNEYQCKECCDILAHELVHGKDAAEIARIYGAEELTAIKADYISLLAWLILGEYSACRETAERYGAFESVEQIEKQLTFVPRQLIWILNDQSRLYKPIVLISYLYYALATRCAFADVSGNEQEHLDISNNCNNRDKILRFIHEGY